MAARSSPFSAPRRWSQLRVGKGEVALIRAEANGECDAPHAGADRRADLEELPCAVSSFGKLDVLQGADSLPASTPVRSWRSASRLLSVHHVTSHSDMLTPSYPPKHGGDPNRGPGDAQSGCPCARLAVDYPIVVRRT